MGIRNNISGGAYGRFQRTANAKLDRHIDDVEFIMEDEMEDAASQARKFISERGVHNTIENNLGRGTGRMENAVDHEVYRRGDVVHGRFGWLPGRERPKEWGWQESGTLDQGEPSGMPSPVPGVNRGIRPMLALKDASDEVAVRLQNRLGGR